MAVKRKTRKPTLNKDIFDDILNDEIKKDVDIVELFNEFGINLTKKGASFTGLCPWHDDKNPSLSVSKEKGLYNCFACGESGDVFTLVQKMTNMSYPKSKEYLKNRKSGLKDIPDLSLEIKSLLENEEPEKEDQASFSKANSDWLTLPRKERKAVDEQKESKAKHIPEISKEKNKEPEKEDQSSFSQIQLRWIIDYYQKKLYENNRALEYLKSRGLTNPEIYQRFKIGFADGSLLNTLSNSQIDSLKEKGILNSYNKEAFLNYIIFPITDETGNTVGIYGRSIDNKAKVKHLYLKGNHKGVFNHKACKVYDEIIITESIIDCLSLIQVGLQNVIPAYGTNGFTDNHLKLLKENRVKTVVIAFDNDEAGKKAAKELKRKLIEEDFEVKIIFPETDWNEDLTNGTTKEDVIKNISIAPVFKKEPDAKENFKAVKEDGKYTFKTDDITYILHGIKDIFISSLRINIKAEWKNEKHFDKLDLYSSRARTNYSNVLGSLFNIEPVRISRDLIKILEHLEKERDRKLNPDEEKKEIELTAEEKEEALTFLKNENIFDQIITDLSKLGYVGEDLNKILLYLCATSRKMDDPISVLIVSQSASGKSYLVDTIKKLIPENEVVSITSLSDQALNYLEDLINKFLVFGEAVHNEIIEHQIREMLSSKELTRLVTMKDEKTGKLKTEEVSKKVIVSSVMSTTNRKINPENASRYFLINADESKEQTKRIYESQRNKYSLDKYYSKTEVIPEIIRRHQNAQRLLKKRIIINTFAKLIDFPVNLMRLRRDHDRFIDLIASVCFLRQYQKEVKTDGKTEYIECDLKDYEVAYNVMINGVLASTLSEIPKGAIELYEVLRGIIRESAEEKGLKFNEVTFTQREIREKSGFGHTWIKIHLKILVDYEYIELARGGSQRKKGFYRLKEDKEISKMSLSMIPTPEEMKEKLQGQFH